MSTLLNLQNGFVEKEPNGDLKITPQRRELYSAKYNKSGIDLEDLPPVTIPKEDLGKLISFIKAQS